ncbi:MAG: hypothetical protein N2V75_00765 [Methanophagales archaeon]|nr:hypothetical protein [Methanophagales archaeon]
MPEITKKAPPVGEGILPIKNMVGISPLGMIVLDNKEVAPKETVVIDTLGFTYITLFITTNRPVTIVLESVSIDGTNWRKVEETIRAFTELGSAFVSLNEVVRTKEVLLYRFMKFRFDAMVPVLVTLEVTAKFLDMLPVLQDIREILSVGLKVPTPRVIVRPVAPPPAVPPTPPVPPPTEVTLADVLTALTDMTKKIEDIYSILDLRFTNPNSWQHDHKTVTTPGTPVKLPGITIPNGYALVVRAMPTNSGNIYLGNSKENAQDASKRITLAPDESTKLEVDKASVIWIDADNAGEGVEIWSEKREAT